LSLEQYCSTKGGKLIILLRIIIRYEKLDKPDSQTTKSSNSWNYKEGADSGGDDGDSQKNSD